MVEQFFTHEDPVWYQIPHSVVILPLPNKPGEFEQLVGLEVGNNQYKLICIPFFLYDIALGDIVHVDLDLPFKDRRYKVVSKSGRYVFRVWFEYTPDSVKKTCLKELRKMGALTERSSKLLYAVDAENLELAQRVADYLMDGESAGSWIYETGQT